MLAKRWTLPAQLVVAAPTRPILKLLRQAREPLLDTLDRRSGQVTERGDAHTRELCLCDGPNPRVLSHRQRRQEFRFRTGRNQHHPPGLRESRGDLRDRFAGAYPHAGWKSELIRDRIRQLHHRPFDRRVCRRIARSMVEALTPGKVQVHLVDARHPNNRTHALDDGAHAT